MNIPIRKNVWICILVILALLIAVFLIWKYYEIELQKLDDRSTTEMTLFLTYLFVDTSKMTQS